MDKPLRILHLEDDPDYSELVRSLLAAEGVEAELVLAMNRKEFEAALPAKQYDIILADYLVPGYSGIEALERARATCSDTPFLLVSGNIGEETAIDSLRAGATDYVLKHRTERLVPAVRRAVQEAEDRQLRRQVEAELRRREKYFRTLTENSLDIVTIIDRKGRFVYNSPSIQRILGYTPDDLTGRRALPRLHPEDRAQVWRGFGAEVSQPGRPVALEFRIRHVDGSWRFVEAVGQNCLEEPEIVGFVIHSRDISERKLAERRNAALSRLGHSLSGATSPVEAARIIRSIADDLFHWDACSLDLYSSELDRLYPILRADTDRAGRRFDLPVLGEELEPSGFARRTIESGASLILRQEPLTMPPDVRPFGEVGRPSASLLVAPIRNRTKVIGILSIQSYSINAYDRQDLNLLQVLADHCGSAFERIRAESALRSSEAMFHSVWESSVDGMRLTDATGITVAVNQAYCRLVGLTREQLEGKSFTVIDEASAPTRDGLQDYIRCFRERVVENQTERRLRLRDGSELILAYSNSFVELRGQQPLLLALFRDVSGQKRLEEQLRQAQKMEAIGQLAGGVAHDFNNILTVIHGHASLLLSSNQLTQAAGYSAQQIDHAAARAAGLTRQLLTFSRRQLMQPRRLDMNEVVGNMTKMLSRILGEDIALKLQYFPQPAVVQADAGMMEQVLLNLAVNSRDAMPQGGLLAVRIGVTDVNGSPRDGHPEARPGSFVCLSVIDTGCGIAPENLRRIFEPFFTTKEVGKGTGLGLATVYGIVKQHQGWIEVESEPGKGTTFRVYLPRSIAAPEPALEVSQDPRLYRGSETILVVEDETALRDLVCQYLTNCGYTVFAAESGAKAIEIWRVQGSRIDLMLTDLVMPDRMNGRELAEKLWAERPDLKIVFTSGYSADVVGRDFVLRPGLVYLQKPYQPHKLASILRGCLDATPAAMPAGRQPGAPDPRAIGPVSPA